MKTVLFVDDERSVLDALRFALFRSKWKLVFACGARAALEEIARQRFDAVVTDLTMPEMDGVELLARVRVEQPDAVRIILTGNIEKTAADRARQVVDEVLAKPCGASVLRECLARRLGETPIPSSQGGILPSPRIP
ncbi:MAG TPA: response regulator [Polyangiaceae bacterium]|jgi:CheY-like chemotaxis protein